MMYDSTCPQCFLFMENKGKHLHFHGWLKLKYLYIRACLLYLCQAFTLGSLVNETASFIFNKIEKLKNLWRRCLDKFAYKRVITVGKGCSFNKDVAVKFLRPLHVTENHLASS